MWWDTHAHRASTHKKKPRMFLVFFTQSPVLCCLSFSLFSMYNISQMLSVWRTWNVMKWRSERCEREKVFVSLTWEVVDDCSFFICTKDCFLIYSFHYINSKFSFFASLRWFCRVLNFPYVMLSYFSLSCHFGCRSLTTFLQYISWIYFLVYDWHSWILTIWASLRWRNNFKKFPFLSRFYLSIKRRTQKKIKVFFLASLRKMFSVHTPNTEQKKKDLVWKGILEIKSLWRRAEMTKTNSHFNKFNFYLTFV